MPLIEPGMKIFVDVSTESVGGEALEMVVLNSIVEEVPDDESLLIQMPMYKGSYYPFSAFHSPLYLRFPTKTSFFAFSARYEGSVKRGPLTLARMQRVSGFEERQMRECFRLPCLIPVKIKTYWVSDKRKNAPPEELPEHKPGELLDAVVKTLPPGKNINEEPDDSLPGHLLDLSDGGTLLATNAELERGDKITLNFSLNFNVSVECVVVRTARSTNQNYQKSYGCSFSNITMRQKERIYQYLVNQQLRKRR
ncbi:MAG: flagellar brake protein [Oscillospiraceae bacterium]|nr:flagellar brake protein [Oscillospiraceae bacterium]